MGGLNRAKCRFGSQIKNYMAISQYRGQYMTHQPANAVAGVTARSSLELEPRKPSPGDKPRNPATHKWRHTGEAKGRIFRDIDPVPFNRMVDVPYGVCFNCWQYDHHQGNCPKPTIDDHCQNCGRIGVKVSNCPRCRRAYQVYHKKNKIQPASDDSSMVKMKNKKEKLVEKSQEQDISRAPSSSPHRYVSYNERFCCEEEPPYDEFDDFTTIIVDESMSTVITSDFLEKFMNFIDAIKYLPAKKKAELAQCYIFEHRKELQQNRYVK